MKGTQNVSLEIPVVSKPDSRSLFPLQPPETPALDHSGSSSSPPSEESSRVTASVLIEEKSAGKARATADKDSGAILRSHYHVG